MPVNLKNLNSELQENRLKDFRKIPGYGSQIFRCSICLHERVYGAYPGFPENLHPYIICEGSCSNGKEKSTIHEFIRVHLGREENC